MSKTPHEGIIRIMALNQTAVPFKVMKHGTALNPIPEIQAEYSGFDIYQTVLMNFAKQLLSDYEATSPEQMTDLMNKAHNVTEAYFERIQKTFQIMASISKEAVNQTTEKNKTISNLIVEK